MSADRIYYLFFALINIGMGATVTAYTPFLQSIGLTLGEIALVNAIFWSVVILSELPTGMLADGKSRSYSLKLGGLCYSIGAFSYLFADSFWSAAFSESCIAIGSAFVSGAGVAWIADALEREGKKDLLRHVYATEFLIKSICMLFGGFVGSAIASWIGYSYIWVPFMMTGLFASFVAHRLMNGQGEPLEYVSELEAFTKALSHLRRSRILMWIITCLIVFGAVVSFNHYWALFFLPQVGQFGLAFIWPVMYLGLIGATQIMRKTSMTSNQEGKMISTALFLAGVGLLGVALGPSLWFSIPALIVHEAGRGFFNPLIDSFVQSRVHTSYRATFGSLQSFLGRIGFAIVPFVVWVFIGNAPNTSATISIVWIVCSIILIVGAMVLSLIYTRIEERTSS